MLKYLRKTTVFLMSIVAAAAFAMPAVAKDKGNGLRDFVGTWSCHTQSEVREPTDPHFIQIFDLSLDKNGRLDGDLLQAQPGVTGPPAFPPIEFRCEISGDAIAAMGNARIALDFDLLCDIPDFGIVDVTASAECLGSARTRGHGFDRMVCLDLEREPDGSEITALSFCERQDFSGNDDDDDDDDD